MGGTVQVDLAVWVVETESQGIVVRSSETTESGHAWVEVDSLVWDLYFFRTLYSNEFNKFYRNEIIALFGTGKGLLAAPGREIGKTGLKYHAIDILPDDIAIGIINGIDHMP